MNKKFSRFRIIIDYIDATKNEIAIDESVLHSSGLEFDRAGYLPRVQRWVAHARRHPKLVYNTARLARLIWTAGASSVVLFFDFLPCWLKSLYKYNEKNNPNSKRYVLAFSPRAIEAINALAHEGLPDSWITVPWITLRKPPANARIVDIFSLLSPSELAGALLNALITQQRFLRRPDTRKWALQGYTAFRWFAVRAGVDKLAGDFVMVNHFDRWAILIDRSAQRLGNSLTLVQHGVVSQLDAKCSAAPIAQNIPKKLRGVRKLFAYNPTEAEIFKNYIIKSGRPRNNLSINFYKSCIKLKRSKEQKFLKFLFVGHPTCENFQVELFERLSKKLNFTAYYKPHPLAPMSPSLESIGWQVIKDPHLFLEVDLLISYPSTLVLEYANHFIPAVIHPMNADTDECEEFVRKIYDACIELSRSHPVSSKVALIS